MSITEWLAENTKRLEKANIATARLDALILLEDATGKDRARLLAHSDEILSVMILSQLQVAIERRTRHEPLAYIRGKSEFYGREFKVTPATLQPRPETETMIELLLRQVKSKKLTAGSIVDVGTGSGCLAITAKLELPERIVIATDINTDALGVARQNSQKLGADVEFYQGNLLQPLIGLQSLTLSPFIVLANLPYVPDNHTINQAAMQEPRTAIFGGPDGLDLYRELFRQLESGEWQVMNILTESLPFQHKALEQIANAAGFKLTQTEDFIQAFIPE